MTNKLDPHLHVNSPGPIRKYYCIMVLVQFISDKKHTGSTDQWSYNIVWPKQLR